MDYNKLISLVYEARNIVFSKTKLSHVQNKNPYDFVTAVDIEISDFLKKELKEAFPNVGFVTEEEKKHSITEKVFILDPIDGTTNLVYNYNMSSISLAYAENGVVMFGVVMDPFAREMFFAIRGNGAYRVSTAGGIKFLLEIGVENYQKKPLQCSSRPMQRALIEFGACSSHKEMTEETFNRSARVFKKVLDLRRICSSAIAVSYIAAGRLDGYFEKIIKPWDYAAAVLILEEAGGKASDWNGQPLPLDREGTIVCSNAVIYEDLLELM